MRLTYFTVSNYRSITTAYKIDMHDITILVGKNNEGKSNLIKALVLAMDILQYTSYYKYRKVPSSIYVWREDFPIDLQDSKKIKKKSTSFRLDFKLDQDEIEKFHEEVGSTINGDLSVYIEIKEDETFRITVPKKGKNATALTTKVGKISKFICNHIFLQYIPAIRSQASAYDTISRIVEEELKQTDDEEYQNAQKYIEEYRERKLAELSTRIKTPLKNFMPSIKSIDLHIEEGHYRNRRIFRDVAVDIDDGVKTSLAQKGDGVKSLTTMALLSKTDAKNRIIIIDEPEAHLHPEAIHYLKKVLFALSPDNQLVVSTHNPIFVNRLSVKSNIIVEKGEAKAASRIDDIRKVLGIHTGDNLMYSDYVIIVEGPSDKLIIEKFLKQDADMSELLNNNVLTVRSIGGVNNLKNEIYNLEHFMCSYMAILDNDGPGKTKAKEASELLDIPMDRFRFFAVNGISKNAELEDLYNPNAYKEIIRDNLGIDISQGVFRNKSKRWSDKVTELCGANGRFLDDDLDKMKKLLSEKASEGDANEWFSADGLRLLQTISSAIKDSLRRVSLL